VLVLSALEKVDRLSKTGVPKVDRLSTLGVTLLEL